MEALLKQLKRDNPSLVFDAGDRFCWSPKEQTIIYDRQAPTDDLAAWALLHEVAHALLGHQSYDTDIDLLLLEVAAWQKAAEIGIDYGFTIDNEHVQDCLDTYRDWLDQRSTCPGCGNNGLQQNPTAYGCFNCLMNWKVSSSRFSRPYRQKNRGKKISPAHKAQTMFT